LALRLKQFAHGGFIHFGQGKWYPGELFPRWQYALYWRKDGLPLWKNDALIEGDTKFTFHDAEKFATELTKYLGLTLKRDSNLRRSYLLGIRGRLPVNLDPLKST
jgi:uncharacterized protein (DUF2126 family)